MGRVPARHANMGHPGAHRRRAEVVGAMGSAKVSRRAFLSLATAVPLVAACTAGEDTSPTTPPPPTPTPTEDSANEDLRLRVAEAETLLIARYDATIAAHPSLTASLTLISEQHREHLQALAPIDVPTPGDVGPIPDDSAAAVAELITAERAAADERTTACAEATEFELARLLALIAASEAGHAEALSTTTVALS